MDILILVPRVVQRYIEHFPETWHNAYPYFNYDNRVVEKRVERGDYKPPYQGPEDLSDSDYDLLIHNAKSYLNPTLIKYSVNVACEDALHMAIRNVQGGLFDGKINANRFAVLVHALKNAINPANPIVQAAKGKPENKTKPKLINPHLLKQLGLEKRLLPTKQKTKGKVQKGIPHLVRTDKGIELQGK